MSSGIILAEPQSLFFGTGLRFFCNEVKFLRTPTPIDNLSNSIIGVPRVGRAVFQDVLINLLQVKQGCAWHYKYYEKDQTPLDRMLYSSAEFEAREKSRGLWSTPANAHNIALPTG